MSVSLQKVLEKIQKNDFATVSNTEKKFSKKVLKKIIFVTFVSPKKTVPEKNEMFSLSRSRDDWSRFEDPPTFYNFEIRFGFGCTGLVSARVGPAPASAGASRARRMTSSSLSAGKTIFHFLGIQLFLHLCRSERTWQWSLSCLVSFFHHKLDFARIRCPVALLKVNESLIIKLVCMISYPENLQKKI